MNKDHYAVIMAGGIGSRFWPMSKSKMPKQFLDIFTIKEKSSFKSNGYFSLAMEIIIMFSRNSRKP